MDLETLPPLVEPAWLCDSQSRVATIPHPICDYLERKKISNQMFISTWVCAVKCTINCSTIHIEGPEKSLGNISNEQVFTVDPYFGGMF